MFEKLKIIVDDLESNSLVIHSDILRIARKVINHKNKLIPKIVADSGIKNFYVPTFTFISDPNYTFTRTAMPTGMGVISNELVNNLEIKDYDRNLNPIHSYGVTNSKMVFPPKNTNAKSFGNNSIFDFFYYHDLSWVCMGADPDQGFTIFHHCEALADVPYRKWIKINKKYEDRGKIFNISYDYFARIDECNYNFNYAVDYLIRQKILKTINIHGMETYYGSSKKIVELISNKLCNDESFLLD